VVGQRQEDEYPLQHADERQAVEELDLRRVGRGPLERLKVRHQVLDEKVSRIKTS